MDSLSQSSVLVVSDDGVPERIAACADFTAEAATWDEVRDRRGEIDCVVVTDPGSVPVGLRSLPIVAYVDDPAAVDSESADAVARRGDERALEDQIRWVLRRTPTYDRTRLARLHEGAATFTTATTTAELFERMVDVAANVLSFDWCYVSTADGDTLVPRAASAATPTGGTRELDVSEGVAGKTYRLGESFLVDDIREVRDARPAHEEYRSGISVPVGDFGVFQALSAAPGAFDLTDLELAELLATHVASHYERIAAEENLREEHDRLSALFENIPDAAVEYELRGGNAYARDVNPAFEEIFGWSASDVVGTNLDDVIAPVDEEATHFNHLLQQGESFRTEVRRYTTDGERSFLLHAVPLELGKTSPIGYAIYTDITDQKRRERELERQNERLEAFANIVSHDLRNPLAIARGYLETAREDGDEAAFGRIETALDRMDALTDDLLELARTGELIGERERVSVGDVAERAWAGVETSDATLTVTGSLELDADESRLREAFENLFRNAVEHAGADCHVTVELTDGGFAVEDDGPGIPSERREAVFDAGESTGEEGIGYGLAIVRRVVEGHGWSIRVTESESGGARFEVRV